MPYIKGKRGICVLAALLLSVFPFVGNVLDNIFDSATEYPAQRIEGVRADGSVFTESVELPRAYSVFVNKFILRDTALFHRFP